MVDGPAATCIAVGLAAGRDNGIEVSVLEESVTWGVEMEVEGAEDVVMLY